VPDGLTCRLRTRFLLVVIGAMALTPTPALAHAGNPNYRSTISAVRPAVPGLGIEVLNYDDRLLLTNRSGKTVLVRGYDGEPYVRVQSEGAVEVNKRAPTYYLNEDRYAKVNVPPQASDKAPPQWQVVAKNGRYEWHDHRIHWMAKSVPPQVKDKDEETRIFDWRVPLVVGAKPARITGTLTWEPEDSGVPPAALIGLGGLAAVSLLLFVVSRRIRTRNVEAKKDSAW
jgi:hypothetical protein